MREVFSGLLSGQGLLVFIRSLAGEKAGQLLEDFQCWVGLGNGFTACHVPKIMLRATILTGPTFWQYRKKLGLQNYSWGGGFFFRACRAR